MLVLVFPKLAILTELDPITGRIDCCDKFEILDYAKDSSVLSLRELDLGLQSLKVEGLKQV